MNLKLEVLLLILGGLLRITSTGSSIWYFLTQDFPERFLYYLCGSFIIAPSVVFVLLTISLVLIDCCKRDFSKIHFKAGLGLMISLGGPLGVPLFVYAFILSTSSHHTGDFYIIEGLSRSTTLVEALFESLPQIAIQVYNNQIRNSWTPFTMASLTLSSLAIVYSFAKLCDAVDKINHYEIASAHVKTSVVPTGPNSDRKDYDDDCEVVEMSNQ
jgi:hypothetical protein